MNLRWVARPYGKTPGVWLGCFGECQLVRIDGIPWTWRWFLRDFRMVKKSSHPQNGELIPLRNHLAPLWRCWYAISIANLNSRRTILPPLVFQSLLKLEDHFVSKTSPNEHSPFTPKRTCRLHLPNIWCFSGSLNRHCCSFQGMRVWRAGQFINLLGCRISTSWIRGQFITTNPSPGTVTPNGWLNSKGIPSKWP